MFELKPDFEIVKARMDAFWQRELIDRPLVQFNLARPAAEQIPLPISTHVTPAQRWLDGEYQTRLATAQMANHLFLGDTLPVAFPNLGPEIFSAFYGCPLHFGDAGTSWSEPILHDWTQADQLHLDWEHVYLHKLDQMTDLLLEAGRGRFIVGMADWHPGGDAIAAFRDPQNLALDMLEHPAEIVRLLNRLEADYFRLYDRFYNRLRQAGQPISTWLPLASDEKYYIPSNDFSIMISSQMFEEFFIPGIRRECQFLQRTIYHLDGPGALRHLDLILSIPELNALQFVPGASNEGFHKWVSVYQRAQAAGKGIQVFCTLAEIPSIQQTLDPHGLFLSVNDVPTQEAADRLLHTLSSSAAWGRKTF